ncbi:hypothetical protein L288_01180 [Sphingobium quisquiliarum P25]|uniref:Uncharacterized protein n=1 Tax=Sphingobium quisquiliarum P25 TaxID=1329909 RepID=T0HQN9_9SPHN|nr:hypothetical protein L288_01180 [Sphingobium quisquiliarum P25]
MFERAKLEISFQSSRIKPAFRPAPAFDLALCFKRLHTRAELLRPDQFYRAAVLRVSGDCASFMLCDAGLEIVRVGRGGEWQRGAV